jgi:hypothetical protein
MKSTMTLAMALLLALAACTEKPQRVMVEPESATAPEPGAGETRERTLRQGEAGRMGS